MKFLQPLLALLAIASPNLTLAGISEADIDEILGPASPIAVDTGRFIVQFSSSGSARFRKRDGALGTSDFFTLLKARDIDFKEVLSFTSDLFHGASFDLNHTTSEELNDIKSLPEVQNVWPASVFTVPTPEAASLTTEATRWSPHNDTNVNLAHLNGHSGQDVVVAIVDTGVDYTHPALGDGLGEGFKVEYGYDFVGDSWEIGDEYAPDDDPQDCNGHGTHVAGIIASGSDIVPGVAPSAKLRAYKVFGCGGSTYEDVIIAAFLKAHEDGADIVSASLGSDRGFPDAPLAVVASAIQAANTFVSIAAGNSGALGKFGTEGICPFYTSSGGNGFGVTTVGSVQHDEFAGFVTVAHSSSGESREIVRISCEQDVYLNEALLQWQVNGTLPAAFFNDTRNVSPCDWTQSGTVPSNSVLVEPRRGDCGWQLHDSYLIGRANYVFFYNFEGADWEIPARAYYDPDRQPKGFGLITYEDGDWIVSQHEQGHNVTFDFVNDNAPVGVGIEGYAVGRINDFTSRGPTLDSRLKPEISAPGTFCHVPIILSMSLISLYSRRVHLFHLSTWVWRLVNLIWHKHGNPIRRCFFSMMAWALSANECNIKISGIAALFFGSQGGRAALGSEGALVAHRRIVASGKPIYHYDGSDNLAYGKKNLRENSSVTQQGSGLVDAIKVIEYGTSIEPVILNLNDTDHFSASHSIKITNSGDESVKYKLNHRPGITIHTKPQANAWVGYDPPYSTAEGSIATVEFSESELEVSPGETASFFVKFTEPSDIDPLMLPVYGGSIEVIGSHGEVVRVTYMGKRSFPNVETFSYIWKGIKGSVYASDTWELERGVPLLLSGYGGVIEEGHNYTFEEGGDVPTPYFNMLWATREVSFDFVARDWTEEDWSYPAVPGEAKYYGSFKTTPQGLSGTVSSFPIRNYPRNNGAVYAPPQNVFAHGGDIPAGEYKILCRALRTFGDPNNLKDWQIKLSPWFRITREKPPPTTTTSASSAITTPTSEPSTIVRPCSATATPISLNVTIGESEDQHGLYRYSDFLSIDLSGGKDLLPFELTTDGYVQTWASTDVLTDLFLNVHSSNNSLVYIYKASGTTGSFSKLTCVDEDGVMKCGANSRNKLYVCDSSSGLIRHDAEVKEGCDEITLHVEQRDDPNCQ
ncbi:unnamed protein product [Clonostachys solani]|uniref:Minor extracellular protease vpr n=1 Tax=Clonostachys solani TaxID=160281 RepID=A0A9N9YXY3_9HYPO|nr:unnamed protein product [Clonostachys solani]